MLAAVRGGVQMAQSATRPDDIHNQTPEERRLAQIYENQALIALLDAWEREDPQEQRETLEMLVRALDEDHPTSRKLFV
jgi:hypothetical protein